MNNVTLEQLVTVKGNVTIQGPVYFAEDVFMKFLRLKNKTKVNFSPEYWVRIFIYI